MFSTMTRRTGGQFSLDIALRVVPRGTGPDSPEQPFLQFRWPIDLAWSMNNKERLGSCNTITGIVGLFVKWVFTNCSHVHGDGRSGTEIEFMLSSSRKGNIKWVWKVDSIRGRTTENDVTVFPLCRTPSFLLGWATVTHWMFLRLICFWEIINQYKIQIKIILHVLVNSIRTYTDTPQDSACWSADINDFHAKNRRKRRRILSPHPPLKSKLGFILPLLRL